MSHGYKLDRFRGMNKKKLVVAALFVGIALLILLVIIGVVVVAIVSALLGQADSGIGQNIGNIFQTAWRYATDFINALWKQIIANPLQFITGGSN
jgi:hypothetical protein